MAIETKKPYELVSIIYDKLMKGVNYKLWGKYLSDIIQLHSPIERPYILEIGAGNCRIADIIFQTYTDYIASDSSIHMIDSKGKTGFQRVCCDMISLPFKGKFDVVISTFDSVNYLLTRKKLASLFKEIKRTLSPEGIFVFDVSLEANSIEFERSSLKEFKHNGYIFERNSKYNPRTRIHKNLFNVEDKFENKYREIHKQKIYKFNTYFKMVEKSGLFVVQCFDAFTFKDANENCERVQFITQIDKSKC